MHILRRRVLVIAMSDKRLLDCLGVAHSGRVVQVKSLSADNPTAWGVLERQSGRLLIVALNRELAQDCPVSVSFSGCMLLGHIVGTETPSSSKGREMPVQVIQVYQRLDLEELGSILKTNWHGTTT